MLYHHHHQPIADDDYDDDECCILHAKCSHAYECVFVQALDHHRRRRCLHKVG